ncbi:hypothetical protein ACFQ6Q_00865 [Streptomyces sp. NPDC056437]|uniref:hypothetical protein n=1 Tax=Streptomyces sp. NPDC056437 TaxID=3345816 RepID=UPI0036C09A06
MTSTSTRPLTALFAEKIREQAKTAGVEVNSDWRLAVVATVNADGTITTTDGIKMMRLDTYVSPTVGDLIRIDQASNGNWWALGRGSTGGIAIGETVSRRKTADTARTNATQAADPHLIFDVVPGTYLLDAFIVYTADAAVDLKLGWFSPASTSGMWYIGGSDSGNSTFAATANWGAVDITTTRPVSGAGTANVMACQPTGTAVVTGTGQLSFAWAQNSGSATATTVRTHSTLTLRRIA